MSLVKNAVDPTKGDLKKFEIRRRIRSYVKNKPKGEHGFMLNVTINTVNLLLSVKVTATELSFIFLLFLSCLL